MIHFNQIAETQRTWSLRPIGIIALEPIDLAERYGLSFASDEQDGSTAAMLETSPGRQYMLLRHFDAPSPGTEILASERSLDPTGDLNDLLGALDLDPAMVTWQLDRDEARAMDTEHASTSRREHPTARNRRRRRA